VQSRYRKWQFPLSQSRGFYLLAKYIIGFSELFSYLAVYSAGKDLFAHISTRGRILGRNPDKSLKSFPPCYSKSPVYSFALRFIFLPNHATSYSFYCALLYTVKEKGGKPKENHTSYIGIWKNNFWSVF
jgi:hypothetical protein